MFCSNRELYDWNVITDVQYHKLYIQEAQLVQGWPTHGAKSISWRSRSSNEIMYRMARSNELSVIVSYPIVKAQLHSRLDEDLCSAY